MTQPRFPVGTPEYDAYAAELVVELDKFVRGEGEYKAQPEPPIHSCNAAKPGQPLPFGRLAAVGECRRCDQIRWSRR